MTVAQLESYLNEQIAYNCPHCQSPFTVSRLQSEHTVACPLCTNPIQIPDINSTDDPVEATSIPAIPSGKISKQDIPFIKTKIKHLRLKKRELSLEKRTLGAKIRDHRESHAQERRLRLRTPRGNNIFHIILQIKNSYSESKSRLELASALEALEPQRNHIESEIRKIDLAILDLEQRILDASHL